MNAVAGAFAGTLVSVVLHPVDTVKVTIQAIRRAQTSRGHREDASEARRVGLYDGLSASLASSAPISALYTASYELVKRRLEPMFPAEKAWVAHCLAGGCASVATSFVYTPSECVKQRCQVSHGAVTALGATRAIVAEGGVFGLYKGWTAVLCRNIPQSAIKFFVFEHLLRLASEAASRSAPTTLGAAASPLPTLAAGGSRAPPPRCSPPRSTRSRRDCRRGRRRRSGGGGAGGAADDAGHHREGGRRGTVSRRRPEAVHLRHAGGGFLHVVRDGEAGADGHAARSEGAEGEAERDKRR